MPLVTARHRQGLLLGKLTQLGFDVQTEAHAEAVTEEVLKSSAIEGEDLDRALVRSSVVRRLGLPGTQALPRSDARTEGVVDVMLDATTRYAAPLTQERLFAWHGSLFPGGSSGLHRVQTGRWRDDAEGAMQVVSGPVGRPRVHYEAPPAGRLESEMAQFLDWFNGPSSQDGLVRTALAHLWFVTVHPFDDGNGRIARAIADMALAQLERSPQRFYSLSSQLQRERSDYYDALERTQRGWLDVTDWLTWFLEAYARAIDAAEDVFEVVLARAAFWRSLAHEPFSKRQTAVLNRLLANFEGKLTARKWAALGKCSVDSAQRDLSDLVSRGVLVKNPGGSKNTSYSLAVAQAGGRR